VSEGEGPDCTEEAKATEENEVEQAKATDDAKPAAETKRRAKVRSRTAGSRRIPAFLRRVDNFLYGR
jgi:hypothetical protein